MDSALKTLKNILWSKTGPLWLKQVFLWLKQVFLWFRLFCGSLVYSVGSVISKQIGCQVGGECAGWGWI